MTSGCRKMMRLGCWKPTREWARVKVGDSGLFIFAPLPACCTLTLACLSDSGLRLCGRWARETSYREALPEEGARQARPYRRRRVRAHTSTLTGTQTFVDPSMQKKTSRPQSFRTT
ncbi:hypothetical protein CC80DRAFT_206863 [Byssothecium circinans]|uniref:Uncharacterized protein n=1 Tax=Byssothecium circinans TaxID=147558 RepID=A0A6A5TI75_9PLEO|nr:hypothetical protein CC80DRAFT_206863 [Byssothecium circinans]